jgi:Tfp pilus assembly protein PilX
MIRSPDRRVAAAKRRREKPSDRRRGAVLVSALVCMLVVMALLGSMLLSTLSDARQLRMQRELRQCELLLQAGLDRAAYRLEQDSDYTGETWTIPAAEIIDRGGGLVTIAVSTSENNQPARLHVVAEYPTGSETSIRRSRSVDLNTQSSNAEEN